MLAPNLTIYNKLIADFTPNTSKYVFQGLAEFVSNPPEIITGDNYESGRGIRRPTLFGDDVVHINIFNISKINSEVRGDKAPRIKRLSEYIGESYFEYLSKLDDLVLLMDESHRYRASAGGTVQKPLFTEPEEQKVAEATLEVLREFERLPSSADLKKPEIMKKIVERVTEAVRPTQATLPGVVQPVNIAQVVEKTVELRNDLSIDIPRIIVSPKGDTTAGFRDFDLDCKNIRLQPVSQEILIQHLQDNSRYRLRSGDAVVAEKRLEDYLVRGLMDFDDVNYDEHATLLYKLAGQMVAHVQSYLPNKDDVLNVLQAHQQNLVQHIHTQMQAHYEDSTTEYDVQVARGFVTLRPSSFSVAANEHARDFRIPVEDKLMIRGMYFTGFKKSLSSPLKFQSDPERRFAVVLENDGEVLKWLRPSKGDFRIFYAQEDEYVPDFAVETKTARYLCEPKRSTEMTDEVVLAKARAARLWCERATAHAGGKPWKYLLIPHDAIDESKTLAGLAATWEFHEG